MKLLTLWLSVFLFGISSNAVVVVWGPPTTMGNGEVRTFIETTDLGEPLSIGVAFPKEAMDGLSEHAPEVFVVALPTTMALPPYNHVMLDWMPHGHEPESVYGRPHFDFHFYMMSSEDRQKITCQGEDEAVCLKQPAPELIPPFYTPTPAGVPQMGWHWVDPRSPEYNGQPFTSTMIYGFYNGEMNFIEPMMTKEFIQATTWFASLIPVPDKVMISGHYPTAYSLAYDPFKNLYYVKLKNLVKKEK
ncbi:DUF5602 domain-containing protein [Bdellovibrio bacteriovorus]|uniref:DUF5602 domain-containing protein n=1 Tax=Bdellovibrio bacteriovorus TaxID=959 RepID=UPI003AA9855D